MSLIAADAVCKTLESYEIKETIGKPLTDWEYGYNCGIERAKSEIECAPTVDAIPVSYFAEELHLIREILARRKDLPMEYRRELEAEKKYLRDWINHWRYESDQGFYGVQWKALSEDEIIAKRKEE